MKIRTAFHVTSLVGLAWAAYGLGTTLTNVGVGLAVAMVGVIGADLSGWRS